MAGTSSGLLLTPPQHHRSREIVCLSALCSRTLHCDQVEVQEYPNHMSCIISTNFSLSVIIPCPTSPTPPQPRVDLSLHVFMRPCAHVSMCPCLRCAFLVGSCTLGVTAPWVRTPAKTNPIVYLRLRSFSLRIYGSYSPGTSVRFSMCGSDEFGGAIALTVDSTFDLPEDTVFDANYILNPVSEVCIIQLVWYSPSNHNITKLGCSALDLACIQPKVVLKVFKSWEQGYLIGYILCRSQKIKEATVGSTVV